MALIKAMGIAIATVLQRFFTGLISTGIPGTEAHAEPGLSWLISAFGGIPGLPDELNVPLIAVNNIATGFAIWITFRSAVPALPGDG